MSALIKIEVLEVQDKISIIVPRNIMIVVPFVKLFDDKVYDYNLLVTPVNFKQFNIDSDLLPEDLRKDGILINTYVIKYKEVTSDDYKILIFRVKDDAEKFLSELKLSIPDFYKNADQYIKFIN